MIDIIIFYHYKLKKYQKIKKVFRSLLILFLSTYTKLIKNITLYKKTNKYFTYYS